MVTEFSIAFKSLTLKFHKHRILLINKFFNKGNDLEIRIERSCEYYV